METVKKINNGIGDLSFIAALAVLLGIIAIVINGWNVIKTSVDTYVENKNGNIIEYTENFIKTKNDKDIERDVAEFITTKKEANMYILSYISDTFLYIIITVIGTIGFWRLGNFYKKENMENPFDEKVIKSLKTTQKIIYSTWVVWIIGQIIQFIIFIPAPASYSSSILEKIIMYLITNAFIQFIIFILEKGQLKKVK